MTTALGEDDIAMALRDIVLCDQRLSDVSGITVVLTISGIRPETRVVLITAWGSTELAIEAKRTGAVAFVDKPLVGDEHVRVVRDALSCAQTTREPHDGTFIGYAERRWADSIARGAFLPEDPKRVSMWVLGSRSGMGNPLAFP